MVTLIDFLLREVWWVAADSPPTVATHEKRSSLHKMFTTPGQLEPTCLLGMLICLQLFLQPLTTLLCRLPLLVNPHNCPSIIYTCWPGLVGCSAALALYATMDVSWVYHVVRGQSIVSVFVVHHVLHILQRICVAFGVDLVFLLDQKQKTRLRYSIKLILVFTYVYIHAMAIFMQIIVLNVALNANDASFVAVLSSSNMLELKGTALRRFSIQNILQITCHDIVERFQIIFFMAMILIQNGSTVTSSVEWVQHAIMILVYMFFLELVVDWMKHGFVVKFNRFPSRIYTLYYYVLLRDFEQENKEKRVYPAMLCRRIGFSCLPYLSVFLCIYAQNLPCRTFATAFCYTAGLFLSCIIVKLLNALILSHLISKKQVLSSEEESMINSLSTIIGYRVFQKNLPKY